MLCLRFLVVSTCASVWGCGASSENYDDKDWTTKRGVESGAWREVESMTPEEETDPQAANHSLRGVRHDLMMAPSANADARCNCVDIVIGTPREPKFAWAGERPSISAEHMIIALRTEGSACTGGTDKRRPSIHAVDQKGNDVIVVIEELGFNRPQALGAIIKKPGPNGALYVRAHRIKGVSVPYAASTEQGGMCRVSHAVERSEKGGTAH